MMVVAMIIFSARNTVLCMLACSSHPPLAEWVLEPSECVCVYVCMSEGSVVVDVVVCG